MAEIAIAQSGCGVRQLGDMQWSVVWRGMPMRLGERLTNMWSGRLRRMVRVQAGSVVWCVYMGGRERTRSMPGGSWGGVDVRSDHGGMLS